MGTPSTVTSTADAARADKFEGIGDPPRVERIKPRRPALVAPLEQQPRRGVDGLCVGRMRLSPEASEIGVDEAGVDRSGGELPTAQEPAQESEIGLRPDDDGVVELRAGARPAPRRGSAP